MEIALIGLPQSGKTTLLRALTRGRSEAGVYGGARQEVHTGVTRLPDPRLDTLAGLFKPEKVVPVEIKYWDVPAASGIGGGMAQDGAGISGQYLNLLQNADALLHVVRAFEDPTVPHVGGSLAPHRDAADMEAELIFSDQAILERRVQRIEAGLKGSRGHERDVALREGSLLRRLKEGLDKDVPIREQEVSPDEQDLLSNYQLLTAKPLLVAFNIDEEALPSLDEMETELDGRYAKPGVMTTALCAKLEMELGQLPQEDEEEFRRSMGLPQTGQGTGPDRVVDMSFRLLSLVSFFTYVSKEVRAWTVPAGTPAVKAAGKIHSDMERGFIRAEVVSFDDLARCGSVAQCRREGLLRLEGKPYPVKDGDVITFLFNV